MPDNQRLNLIPLTIEILQSIKAGAENLYSNFGILLPIPFTEFPESIDFTLNQLKDNPTRPPFQSYGIITKDRPTYVGQTGFLAPPDEDGMIEFGYEIALHFRGQGYADEAVKTMINIAFDSANVKTIIAHTLNVKNASNHILIKNHFIFEKVVMSQENGTIWQWKLPKNLHLLKQMF